MALGDINGSNNNKTDYRDPVYSNIKFSNSKSQIEKSALNWQYWGGLMKVSIAPIIESNDDSVKYDHDKAAFIYLSPSHCYILMKQIEAFRAGGFESKGVKNKKGNFIKIANGNKYQGGSDNSIVMVIESFDATGKVIGGHIYEFKDIYYGIDNLNEETFDFERTMYSDTELDMFYTAVKEFYTSSNGASAYHNMDYARFSQRRLSNQVFNIAKAVGASSNNKSRNNNYSDPFENNSSSNNSSNFEEEFDYNDIESQLE